MSMTEWAKNEVELAKIANSKDGDELDGYVCACYESALEAFNVLCNQGHSGMSINITKDILVRLIAGRPLTPIEDTEDVWSTVPERHCDGTLVYQCKRMSSLFKNVELDGSVTYHDVDRVLCRYVATGSTFHGGFESRWYDETHPITFPYYPYSEAIMMHVDDFLYDTRNGDFDTIAILYITYPDGRREEVNKYFKEEVDDFVEISKEEYEERYSACMERILSKEEEK